VGGRIDVEANDIAQLADEVGIVRKLELAKAVRLCLTSAPLGQTELI
jgi:hypothetical protein